MNDSEKLRSYRKLLAARPDLANNPQDNLLPLLLSDEEIESTQRFLGNQFRSANIPPEWADIGVVFEDRFIIGVRDAVSENGKLLAYLRLIEKPLDSRGIVIFPVFEGRLVLLKQFRHAPRCWNYELPRGFGDSGCNWEENARREMREEIAANITMLILAGSVHPNSGLIANSVDVAYAEIDEIGTVDGTEGISEVLQLTKGEFKSMVSEGKITDGFTLSAFSIVTSKQLW